MSDPDGSDNLDLVRRMYGLGNRMAVYEILELVTDDIEWDIPPDAPEASPNRGKPAVLKSFEGWVDMWDSIQMEILDLSAHGAQVLAAIRNRATARGSDSAIESNQWDVWTIRDGLVSRMQMFSNESAARAALEPATQGKQTTEAHT